MAKKKPLKPTTDRSEQKMLRTHRVSVALNDKEWEGLQRYFKRYKISNKTRLVREVLMRHVIERMQEDTPSLFDQPHDD
ncbi:MAG: hypothetical protein J5808_02860 [Paludibacteraceae bacterium]|nr:hypothetical protein [Paludibacteraceae bacterium]